MWWSDIFVKLSSCSGSALIRGWTGHGHTLVSVKSQCIKTHQIQRSRHEIHSSPTTTRNFSKLIDIMEIHIYSSSAHTHYSQAQVSFTHLQSHRTHAYVPFQYLLSAYFSSFSFNTPKSWSTFLHMLKLKFHMSLTLIQLPEAFLDPKKQTKKPKNLKIDQDTPKIF